MLVHYLSPENVLITSDQLPAIMDDMVVENQARTCFRLQRMDNLLWYAWLVMWLRLVIEVCGASFKSTVQVDHEGLDALMCIPIAEAIVTVWQKEASWTVSARSETWVQTCRLPGALQHTARNTLRRQAKVRNHYVLQERPCTLEKQLPQVLSHNWDTIIVPNAVTVASVSQTEAFGLRDNVFTLVFG